MHVEIVIELGNDAMKEPEDVAQLLRRIAERIDDWGWEAPKRYKDANGNTVGHLEIK